MPATAIPTFSGVTTEMSSWRTSWGLLTFCVLTVITTFTNKYVLSILKFTYPTVFQSWQTGTTALFLLTLNALGYIEVNVLPGRSLGSAELIGWLPGIIFFTGMIYSGSVALSKLPIPVFCALHSVTFTFTALVEWILFQKIPPFASQVSLIVVTLAGLAVTETDPQFDRGGYSWMMVHCGLSGLYHIYKSVRKPQQLSELDQMFYNAAGSIVILMLVSTVTGELYQLVEFPSLYHSRFHAGCLVSGVFGALLGITRTFLSTSTEFSTSVGTIESANKVALVILSPVVFEAVFTTRLMTSISLAVFAGVFYSYTLQQSVNEALLMPQIHVY